jgi:chromosome segregation ATPase
MILLEQNVSQLREEQTDSQNQIRLTQEGAQGNEERLQEKEQQLGEVASELTEMREHWKTEVAYRQTKEAAVADLLAKLRLLEQSNATIMNTIRAKEVALKRF